jgi:hypothetical protein
MNSISTDNEVQVPAAVWMMVVTTHLLTSSISVHRHHIPDTAIAECGHISLYLLNQLYSTCNHDPDSRQLAAPPIREKKHQTKHNVQYQKPIPSS